MSSSRFLIGCCEKNLIEGEIGEKRGKVYPSLRGRGLGRKLARSTVRRTTSLDWGDLLNIGTYYKI